MAGLATDRTRDRRHSARSSPTHSSMRSGRRSTANAPDSSRNCSRRSSREAPSSSVRCRPERPLPLVCWRCSSRRRSSTRVATALLFAFICVLALATRPLNRIVDQEAERTAEAGMEFATSLSEVSQLGLEMHIFNVQPSAKSRLTCAHHRNRATNQRLDFWYQFIPTTYATVSYLALIAALGGIWLLGDADLAAIGAVTLLMFRAIRYGQNSAAEADRGERESAVPPSARSGAQPISVSAPGRRQRWNTSGNVGDAPSRQTCRSSIRTVSRCSATSTPSSSVPVRSSV
jgi:hypothetical protein